MTTYQQGKQPDGAPVTWEQSAAALRLATIHWPSGAFSFHEIDDAESICRAFHLAKFAEEAAKYIDEACKNQYHAPEELDWLRRYREAAR